MCLISASGGKWKLHPWTKENKFLISISNAWNRRVIYTDYSVSNFIMFRFVTHLMIKMHNHNRFRLTKDANQILKSTWNALYKSITVFSWKAGFFSIIFGPAFNTNIKYVPTMHNIGPGDPIKGQVSTTGSVMEKNIISLFFYENS